MAQAYMPILEYYGDPIGSPFLLWKIESRQVAFFGAKLLLSGGTSSDAALAVGVLAGSLPQFFSYLQN